MVHCSKLLRVWPWPQDHLVVGLRPQVQPSMKRGFRYPERLRRRVRIQKLRNGLNRGLQSGMRCVGLAQLLLVAVEELFVTFVCEPLALSPRSPS